MKVRITTDFWKMRTTEKWRHSFEKYNLFMGFIVFANFLMAVYYFNWIMVIFNGVAVVTVLMIILSFTKYTKMKNELKNKDLGKNLNNGDDNNE